MGVSTAGFIAQRLTAAGRAGATPALIVESASRSDERRILTTLAGLATAAEGLKGPALLMVGEAMAMADIKVPGDAATVAVVEVQNVSSGQ
jgi:uroporphyrin-III C-methyltransferase